jgi:hypothetical protein
MLQQFTGFPPPNGAVSGAVANRAQMASVGHSGVMGSGEASGLLAAADRDHIEREIIAIEHATAVLRQGEPGLESWTDMPAPIMQKPRPIWLLIGMLWLSTALATAGAAVAISALVG